MQTSVVSHSHQGIVSQLAMVSLGIRLVHVQNDSRHCCVHVGDDALVCLSFSSFRCRDVRGKHTDNYISLLFQVLRSICTSQIWRRKYSEGRENSLADLEHWEIVPPPP